MGECRRVRSDAADGATGMLVEVVGAARGIRMETGEDRI